MTPSLLQPKKRLLAGRYLIDVRRARGANGRPVVILVHGIGVSGTYFTPFAEALAARYDVRLIDLPGYGRTPRPDHALSIGELADVLAAYMAATVHGKATVIGHSMGCQIAVRVALKHPLMCKNIVLIGPTVTKWERNLPLQALRLLQDTLREPLAVNTIIASDYLRMGGGRYLQTARHMMRDPIENDLLRCKLPVLIVRGGNDRIASRRWATYLAGHAKKYAQVAEIAGSPHVVQFVKPNELLRVCEPFFKK